MRATRSVERHVPERRRLERGQEVWGTARRAVSRVLGEASGAQLCTLSTLGVGVPGPRRGARIADVRAVAQVAGRGLRCRCARLLLRHSHRAKIGRRRSLGHREQAKWRRRGPWAAASAPLRCWGCWPRTLSVSSARPGMDSAGPRGAPWARGPEPRTRRARRPSCQRESPPEEGLASVAPRPWRVDRCPARPRAEAAAQALVAAAALPLQPGLAQTSSRGQAGMEPEAAGQRRRRARLLLCAAAAPPVVRAPRRGGTGEPRGSRLAARMTLAGATPRRAATIFTRLDHRTSH